MEEGKYTIVYNRRWMQLDSIKIHKRETYEDIIQRLLSEYENRRNVEFESIRRMIRGNEYEPPPSYESELFNERF